IGSKLPVVATHSTWIWLSFAFCQVPSTDPLGLHVTEYTGVGAAFARPSSTATTSTTATADSSRSFIRSLPYAVGLPPCVPLFSLRLMGQSRLRQTGEDAAARPEPMPPQLLTPSRDAAVGIVWRMGAGTPEAEPEFPGSLGEFLEAAREHATAALVEVGRGGTDADELEVHVQSIARANDIPKKAPVPIHLVRGRLGHQPHLRPDRKNPLRPR